MARLALRLQVFIASPSDIQRERDLVEGVVLDLSREAARQDLLLNIYRFERDAIPACQRPMDHSNVDLRSSELVIVIFGEGIGSPSRVGSTETGTLEEFRIAEALVRTGHVDNLFLYYRIQESSRPAPKIAATIQAIIESRKQIVWPYTTPEELSMLVRRHIQRWLEGWYGIPQICRHAFESSDLALERKIPLGENRLEQILRAFGLNGSQFVPNHLGKIAVAMYQQHGPNAADMDLTQECVLHAIAPFVQQRKNEGLRFRHPELFYLACAAGLQDAILNNNSNAVEHKAYINQIHQYLSVLVSRMGDISNIVNTLCEWLSRRQGARALRPTARNFAAYVLGMIGALCAADNLAESLVEDSGEGVRLYCITSLGKLRSRRHLPLLRDLYRMTHEASEQNMIAKAICRIIGVAHFEL